jgi:hypothetical protein
METVMSNEAVAVLSPGSGYGFYADIAFVVTNHRLGTTHLPSLSSGRLDKFKLSSD